jgi:hypothetical protein
MNKEYQNLVEMNRADVVFLQRVYMYYEMGGAEIFMFLK